MLYVLTCITHQHDYMLLALAALVCVAGSWIGIKTFIRVRSDKTGTSRRSWLLISSVAVGSAIWATHFLAMLAYKPGLEVGWDLHLTMLSLVVAGLTTAAGLFVGSRANWYVAPELGGGIIGLGIGAMHYLGMHAFQVAGLVELNSGMVWASLATGVFFGALSLSRAARPVTRFCKYGGTTALVLAICGLHFTAMTAVTIIPDPSISIAASTIPDSTVGFIVAAVAFVVIAMSFAAHGLELTMLTYSTARLRKLANATTEGIIVTREGRIIDVNDRFLALAGRELLALKGTKAEALWTSNLATSPMESEFEAEIVSSSGEFIPVEVIKGAVADGERIYAVRDLRAKRASEAQIFHMTHHDGLTGLINRASFTVSMEQAVADGAAFAVMYIDVDQLKMINDGYGTVAGDIVLVEIARRVAQAMPHCVIGRLAGDEFAVLKPLDHPGAADEAEELAAALRVPFDHNGASIAITASLGVVRYPIDGKDTAELLANADIAMRAAKVERVSGMCRFETAMRDQVQRRRTLSRDLLTAVEDGALHVLYQVQQSVKSGETTGFEALLRWQHPELGLISPTEFVPLAEENGAIVAIGEWVMKRACLDAKAWPASVKVAVNLSPAQFHDSIDATVLACLIESGLAPSRLEVEITESLLIENPNRVLTLLRRIKGLGVSIAMDDFGTGFSSLSTLQAFPFDKIKIDKSFVERLESNAQAAAIVRAVVHLGLSLNIPVLAEGVELKSHLDFLREQGCTGAQGYLLGKPTPLHETQAHIGLDAHLTRDDSALLRPADIAAAA